MTLQHRIIHSLPDDRKRLDREIENHFGKKTRKPIARYLRSIYE